MTRIRHFLQMNVLYSEQMGPGMLVNPRILISIIPILAYMGVRQIANTQIAIGSAVALALAILFTHRRRRGIIGFLAVMGVAVLSGGAVVGIVLNSDRAFLANDPVGNFITAGVDFGSILIGRPLAGPMTREFLPRTVPILDERHRVFVLITFLWALTSICIGGTRLIMLDRLSINEYIIWSRVLSWTVNSLLILIGIMFVARAVSGELSKRVAVGEEA